MSLDFVDSEALFGRMLDGEMSETEIREVLVTMADRGEVAAEIAGAAQAMRARMIRIEAPANAIDVCGTGGDGQHSLNISTAVAIVVAACGVPVAKHGNRAASSKAGAADTLEALGLNLDRAIETAEETLADLGICFLFAGKHHPAIRHVMPIRRELGRRTIFNLIGPLANPAGVKRQLIGVASTELLFEYAEALRMLDSERFLVVCGTTDDKLPPGKGEIDELSISAGSSAAEYPSRTDQSHGPMGSEIGVSYLALNPRYAGLPFHPADAINGGDPAYNAAALSRLLLGEAGAYRDAVIFNAAAALMVADEANDLQEGAEEAAEVIDKGLAKALLDCWIDAVK